MQTMQDCMLRRYTYRTTIYYASTISYRGLNYTNKSLSSSNSSSDINSSKKSCAQKSLCLNNEQGFNTGADLCLGSRICLDPRFLWRFSDFTGGVAPSPLNSWACRFGHELLRNFVSSVVLPSPPTVSPAFTSSTPAGISPNALTDDAGVTIVQASAAAAAAATELLADTPR